MKKEDIIKLYQSYRLYIFPFVIILASSILIFLVIYPQTIKLITNQKAQGQILNKYQFLETKAQALESYDSTDLNQKVDYAVRSYPVSKDYISALSILQNLISQSSFASTSLTILGDNSKEQKNPSPSYGIKIDVVGPITRLPSLLFNIDNSPRLMRVNSVEVTPGKDPTLTTASIIVEVLYSKAQGSIGSIDSPLPELSDKDQELINKLAKTVPLVGSQPGVEISIPTQLGPRGKANPFE